MPPSALAWSGGKDAAYALSVRLEDDPPVELFTTINTEHDRSTMHGVRRELYERQAAALDLPITLLELPPEPGNDEYERIVEAHLQRYAERGIQRVVFGDLQLEDVRAYREERLADTGIDGEWPIWGRDTARVARSIVDAGVEAVVVAADAEALERSVLGRRYDESFLADLPPEVDPCGENGEFHTFVVDGPGFERPVGFEVGETVTRTIGDGEFHFVDLLPDGVADRRDAGP